MVVVIPLLLGNDFETPPAITGEVRSLNVQPLYTPFAVKIGNAPVMLRYYVPDGTEVTQGQIVLRFDPGYAASSLRKIDAERVKAEATAAKEIAELEVKAVDAELASVDAEANLAKARVDAELPREFISALNYDRFQGTRERAEQELSLRKRELTAARAAVQRRHRDSQLELERFRLEQRFLEAKINAAEVRAEQAGVVLHSIDLMSGKRFDEGSTSFAGLLVGEIVRPGAMAVRAYALEADRKYFAPGKMVTVKLDALPDEAITGRIESIAAVPTVRALWGDGRYFTLDVALPDEAQDLPLLPGMSAKVRMLPAVAGRGTPLK